MRQWSRTRACWSTLGLVVGLLAGCTFSPERAVIGEVLDTESRFHPDLKARAIDILQAQEWYDGYMVLIRYPMGQGNTVDECYGLYRAERHNWQWQVNGWATCKEEQKPDKPVSMRIRSGQTSGSNVWSEAYGRVYAKELASIQVAWDDGETQEVGVVNRTYLALREGTHEVAEVRGLDAGGQVLFALEPSKPK